MTKRRNSASSGGSSSKRNRIPKKSASLFKSIESDVVSNTHAPSLAHHPNFTPDTDAVTITTIHTTSNSRLLQRTKDLEMPNVQPLPQAHPRLSASEESSLLYDEFGSFNPTLRDDDFGPAPDELSQGAPTTHGSAEDESHSGSDLAAVRSNSKGRTNSRTAQTRKPNRTLNALRQWIPHRQTILDEILRSEGIGDGELCVCVSCKGADAHYKCIDCLGNYLHCSACLVTQHQRLPFHRIQKYNGRFFEKTSLRDLGMRIQIGHENGSICYKPVEGPREFTVLHVNGLHRVAIDFCDCGYSTGGHHHFVQLIRISLFPATLDRPSTAITFDCLDSFLEQTHSSKMNTYDYYVSLAHMTENTGKEPLDARYHEFSLATRLWRHFMALKRAGRGHDPSGTEATKEGSLTVRCPACPNPGRNLPENWKELPKQYLYTLFLGIDANFRLKLKDRGFSDLNLAPGWSYFVEGETFHKFLNGYNHETEVNTCRSQHNALLHATTINPAGYLATGVGAVVCGRHSYVRPSGVVNLQLGERYVNMDYIILDTLKGNEHSTIFLSYDIACQWSKNFRKRQAAFPPSMRISENVNLRFGVPSFHIAGHGASCQNNFSLNLLPEVGRTYGEGIESQWSHMNGIGASTKEQAYGMRCETLEDHWNYWNWLKITMMGTYFKKCLISAITQYRELSKVFTDFSSTFDAKTLEGWTSMIVDWEQDASKPNPYAEVSDAVTLNDVRLQLAQEEAIALQSGSSATSRHRITASSFLSEGLELEERQRVLLLRDTIRDHQINNTTATLQERRNSLWVSIEAWRRIQDLKMPSAAALRVMPTDEPTSVEDGAVKHPESLRLCLPSSMPDHLLDDSLIELRKKELRLRIAQAEDALSDIRRLRRTMTGVSIFKKLNVSGTGQRANTRVRSIYDHLSKSCSKSAERYRAAHAALTALDPNGIWSLRLKVLRDEDISGPRRDPDTQASEGRYKLSWIWCTPDCNTEICESSSEFSESMRVEWSRARARQDRWREELELLTEEMRRIVADMEWRSRWWEAQKLLRQPTVRADVTNGLQMYANKQAAYMHDIARRCAHQWAPVFKSHNIPAPWLEEYVKLYPPPEQKENAASGADDVIYDLSSLFKL